MEPGTTVLGAAMELHWGCNEERALLPAAWQVEDGDAHHRCCNEVSVAASGIAMEQVLLQAARQVEDGAARHQ